MAGMPQEAAPPEATAGGEANPAIELVKNISQGLTMLAEVLTESGISPEGGQKVQALNEQFQTLVSDLVSGKGAAPAGPPPAKAGMASAMGGAGGKPIPPGA